MSRRERNPFAPRSKRGGGRLWKFAATFTIVLVLIFVMLLFVPDGSGTSRVKMDGYVTYHFGGSYSIDSISVESSPQTIISMPFDVSAGALWSTGTLVLTVSMNGPTTVVDNYDFGVKDYPLLDTSYQWGLVFPNMAPGHYTITYTLTENGAVKATRSIQKVI